ncbi:uncharacterized protein LOC120698306 isoform X3 [Panicum virgatum]|nr:uncharacterized protein LOC120698306 isoform X3 [Panicum virgatum]
MVLKGKGKLVASDPTSGVTTKASASRRGEKRRRGLGDEAEPPPSLPDAKRPGGRCGCVPKTVDDYDLDNGCILAEARAGHEQQFPLGMPVLESLMRSKKPWEYADKLVPFVHFTRHVREITEACSSEKLRWTPEALLLLKGEAEVYLFDVFAVVIRLARDTLAQPIPWYGKNTRLTPEQEETVFALSCGTSGIPVYVHNMSYSDVKSRSMCLPGEYCQRFLVPRLGSNVGKIKIFFGNNLTSSEVKFSTLRENFRLIKGWHDFIKNNCIVEGNNYAFTFEEEKEGSPLSIRVDTLNDITSYSAKEQGRQVSVQQCSSDEFTPNCQKILVALIPIWSNTLCTWVLDSEYGQEQHQRPQRSREATIPLGYMAAVRRTASTLIPYLHFARMVADCCPSGSRVKRNKLLSLHEAAVEHLVSLYELVYQFAVNQAVANQFATG